MVSIGAEDSAFVEDSTSSFGGETVWGSSKIESGRSTIAFTFRRLLTLVKQSLAFFADEVNTNLTFVKVVFIVLNKQFSDGALDFCAANTALLSW